MTNCNKLLITTNKGFTTKYNVMFCLVIKYLFHSVTCKYIYNFYMMFFFWIYFGHIQSLSIKIKLPEKLDCSFLSQQTYKLIVLKTSLQYFWEKSKNIIKILIHPSVTSAPGFLSCSVLQIKKTHKYCVLHVIASRYYDILGSDALEQPSSSY